MIHDAVVEIVEDEEDTTDIIVSLQIDNPMMKINGMETEIDAGRWTKPVVMNGRTLVPIRAIIEAFGGSVSWEETSQTVLLTMENDIIKLGIDKKLAYLNNAEKVLDVVGNAYIEVKNNNLLRNVEVDNLKYYGIYSVNTLNLLGDGKLNFISLNNNCDFVAPKLFNILILSSSTFIK